jgi:hypothetical protein
MHVGGSLVDRAVERNISVLPLPFFANKKGILTIFVTLFHSQDNIIFFSIVLPDSRWHHSLKKQEIEKANFNSKRPGSLLKKLMGGGHRLTEAGIATVSNQRPC